MDSIHGGSGHEGMTPLDQQYQLFASSGAIKFPIHPVTEAWKEKVSLMEIYMVQSIIVTALTIYLFIVFPLFINVTCR